MGLGVVFSGQGNQYLEMLRKLFQYNHEAVAELAQQSGIKLIPEIVLTSQQLFANHYAQPLIAGYEYLLWQEISSHIPAPLVMSGYSLGEMTAFAVSAGLSLEELLASVKIRAQLMDADTSQKSGLVAISGLNKQQLLSVCEEFCCYLAIQNGSDQFVIGGESNALSSCVKRLTNLPQQVKITPLEVSVASHTPLLRAASNEFAVYLNSHAAAKLAVKLVAGISANIHYTASTYIPELARQIQTTIYFNRVVEVMYEAGADVILEIGPGKALSGIIKKCLPQVVIKSVDDFKSIDGLIAWVNKNLET